MPLPPLNFGSTADPIATPASQQQADLLSCGPLDLALLNGLLKLLADRINAVDAADNAIVSASYNAATNELTFSMADGPAVAIDMTALVNDAIGGALITSSSYNATTNLLTVTFGNGSTANIDMTAVLGDAVSGAVTPAGGIIGFTGATVPAGWALCDGTNGTPDLRDRFIVGAGPTYAAGSIGGTATHNHSGTTGDHVLTRGQLPFINDLGNGVGDQITSSMIYGTKAGSAPDNMNNDSSSATVQGLVEPFGNDEPHNHAISSASNLPPYYALAFIMKL